MSEATFRHSPRGGGGWIVNSLIRSNLNNVNTFKNQNDETADVNYNVMLNEIRTGITVPVESINLKEQVFFCLSKTGIFLKHSFLI